MVVRAIIAREPPWPLREWLACIDERDDLVRPEPRQIRNPFTGQQTMFEEPEGVVRIMRGGDSLGAIEPSPEFEEDGELVVYSKGKITPGLREVLEGLAGRLGASLEWNAEEEDDDKG